MQEERPDEDFSEQESEGEEEWDETETKRLRCSALTEFRLRVEEAILGICLLVKDNSSYVKNGDDLKRITLWGVPLLRSAGHEHEGTNNVLAKFLKAKRYKVNKAFALLQKTLKWRAEFWRDDDVVGEDYRRETADSLWFTDGTDKEGRPLCYTVLGKESRKRLLNTGDHNKSQDYLRWRIQCLEKGIQNLSFSPGGVDSFIQIIDLKNAAGIATKEVRLNYKKMIALLRENYLGLVYRTLIINVPSWFLTINALHLRLTTRRSNNRFIFVKPSKVTETLLKYATAENILVRYGGLKRENDTEFSTDDKVLEANIRANATEQIKIPISEAEIIVTWDVTVVGYEVMYREEFVPDDDCSYKILLQERKMGESIRNSFYIREPGKIVITIVNGSYTKKKAFYRYKSRPSVPMYAFVKSS